ncbi:MAG TPA: DUF4347 domain-containing protein [Gemmataceae bacterium]|nr:DUF4347 domain-containing protein [Gemmataceae bacterium]
MRVVVNSLGHNADVVNYLHTALSRVWPAASVDAVSLADAVSRVIARAGRQGTVHSLQFWGHGRPGAMSVGDEEVTPESFAPGHPHFAELERLRPYLADNAFVCFKGCQTFAGGDGKRLARAASAFFGRGVTVAGHTRLLGYDLDWGGLARLRPDREPDWPDVDPRDKALRKPRLRERWRRFAALFRRRGAAVP